MPVATSKAQAAARRLIIERADARALALAPLVAGIRASGKTGPSAIGAELMRSGVRTPRGQKFWTPSQVTTLLKRLDRLQQELP
jgi:hypothetical protein